MALNLQAHNAVVGEILYLSFSGADSNICCIGTEVGFQVIQCSPFKSLTTRTFNQGIGIVELMESTNFMALVGGGKKPCFPCNSVKIWNDEKMTVAGKVEVREDVKAVRLCHNHLIVATELAVSIFQCQPQVWDGQLNLVNKIATVQNACGVFASVGSMLATPHIEEGSVHIHNLQTGQHVPSKCHDGPLAMLALSKDAVLMATASIKGTVIRVHNLASFPQIQPVRTFRRGQYPATIFSLAFDSASDYLLALSGTPTLHIFSLKGNATLSWTGMMRSLVEKETQEYAVVSCKDLKHPAVCSFGDSRRVIHAVTSNGDIYNFTFDPEAGTCKAANQYALLPQPQRGVAPERVDGAVKGH